MSSPLPATAGTWHDHVPAVAEAARVTLRLTPNDQDVGRLPGHAAAACSAIDQRLQLLPRGGRMVYDVAGVPVVTYPANGAPPDVVEAAVQLTVALFHRKDAPLGVLSNGMAGPTYVSRDQLSQVQPLLDPYMEGVGLA